MNWKEILVIGFIWVCVVIQVQAESTLIVNEDSNIEFITYEDVYMIFTFKRTKWNDNSPIQLILLPESSPGHLLFLKKYIGIGITSYMRRIENQISSGRSDAPIFVDTEQAVIVEISNTSGSIGYITGFIISAEDAEGVKELKVK